MRGPTRLVHSEEVWPASLAFFFLYERVENNFLKNAENVCLYQHMTCCLLATIQCSKGHWEVGLWVSYV